MATQPTPARVADALWRAAAYCLHPAVIASSALPVLIMGAAAWFLAYFFWEDALDAVNSWDAVRLVASALSSVGLGAARAVIGQLLLMMLATPVIVIGSLLLVAAMMAPWMVKLVVRRRFPTLERRKGGTLVTGTLNALWVTLLALVVLIVSMPLWLIPPVVLVLPPLIWGWLTYRVMSYDVLADHASVDERREIVRAHRLTLLGMGVLSGYVTALPSVVWGFAPALIWAPFVVLVAIWVYTLVFAFSALWFSHYLLSALADLRAARAGEAVVVDAPVEVLP